MPDSRARAGRVAALILAAGVGRRFGRAKALVEFRDEPLLTHALRLAFRSALDPSLVVLGAQAGEICAVVPLGTADVVVATDWQHGMGASLRAGLEALEFSEAGAAVVMLVDQPLIGVEAIARLRSAWERGAVVAAASYDGQRRNPVLIDRCHWADVRAAAHGDIGARDWLSANSELVAAVDCTGTGDAADIDTPADLTALS